jgi:hypothetical protein
MAALQLVAREAFHAAIVDGDLVTIQSFFLQPHARIEVQATNAFVVETQATDASTFTSHDGSLPWFRCSKTRSFDEDDVPLLTAARRGHVHVLAWVFSEENAGFMGETLALLLRLLTLFDGPQKWHYHNWVSDPVVMETLLTCSVFGGHWIAQDQWQSILNDAASWSQNLDIVALAIAHGASLDETSVATIARCGPHGSAALLERAGVCLAGAKVFDAVAYATERGEWTDVASFLARGVDWGFGSGATQMLIAAVQSIDPHTCDECLINALLPSNSYVDVDDVDDGGKTALMHLASIDYDHNVVPYLPDPTPEIAEQLLPYCDVHVVDRDGRTALHYAAESNFGVAQLLLANRADPNLEADGNAPHGCVSGDGR